MKSKWSFLVIFALLFGLLIYSSTAQAAPEPAEVALSAPQARETISAGYDHSCGIRTDGTLACWGNNLFGQYTPPAGTFTQVSSGRYHDCAIKADGTLACWGNNESGQATPPSGTFVQVSAGGNHTCGIKTDGTLACWGQNSHNEATPPSGTFTQVSSGGSHTCGLRTGGTLACWGWTFYGQLNVPTGTFTQVKAGYNYTCGIKTDGTMACWGQNIANAATAPSGTFTQVSPGFNYTCVIKTDGTLACWGDNYYGQLNAPAGTFTQLSSNSYHTCGLKTNGTLACWGSYAWGESSPPAGTFGQRRVTAGYDSPCSLKADGTLACWGYNGYGEATPPGGTFVQVSPGYNYACGIKTDGTLACWGDITYGQLNSIPSGTFTQVSSGIYHGCGLKTDGTLACWGSDGWGMATPPAGTFTQVSSGDYYNCGLKTDGTLACWGWNNFSTLDAPAGTFTQVSSGALHSCGIQTDGTLACWGYNGFGEATPPGGTFTQVSAGDYHTCGILTDGTLACWGDNEFGQLNAPAGTFTQVSAGKGDSCGVRTDGMLLCWGDMTYGQLISLEPADLPAGVHGAAYSQTLTALGGTAPYIFSISDGSLPPGLELSTDGTLSGTPAGASTYAFTVQVVDANFLLATQDFTLEVVEAVAPQITQSPAGLAVDDGAQVNFSAAADGLPSPVVQWELSADSGITWNPVDGASSTSLAFTASSEQNGYQYRAVFTNIAGSATTSAAALVVNKLPPVLTSISPASAVTGSGDLTLAVTGSSFYANSVVRWNGSDLATTYVSPSELTALIPSASLASVQTAQVSVFTPAPGGGNGSVLAFFVTQATANVTGQKVTAGTNPNAAAGPATAAATGDGLLAVANYDANPGGTPSFSASGTYFDVYAAPGNSFNQVSITACNLNGGNKLYWWDAATVKWVKASPQSYNASTGCVTLVVDAASSPSLSQLQGAFFAAEIPSTTTTLSASTNSALLNQPITFTAAVAPVAPADVTPTGSVTFIDGTTTLAANVPLVNGQAQLATSSLVIGPHVITAVYSGDPGWQCSASSIVNVKVIYQFVGFSQPVDNNGVLNIAKAGQGIPLKFRLLDYNGSPVSNLASVSVTVTSLSCSAGTTTDLIEEYTSGTSGLQNLGDGYYQWNWKTPTNYANSCKTLKLDLGEGAGNEHIALFQLKK